MFLRSSPHPCLRRDAESVLPRSGVKGGLPHLGSPAKRTLDAAQRPRRCRMAASAAFERLQPWSAYWLALRARTDSAPRLLLLLSPDFKARKSVALTPSELLAHLVLEHWLRRCAPVTHQDQGRPRLAARGPWLLLQPQKTLCSPPCPIEAAERESAAQFFGFTGLVIQPLVVHGTGATNSLTWGGIGAGVQSVFMVLPTHGRHCRRRPH